MSREPISGGLLRCAETLQETLVAPLLEQFLEELDLLLEPIDVRLQSIDRGLELLDLAGPHAGGRG